MSIQSLQSDLMRSYRQVSQLESQRAKYSRERADALRHAAEAQKALNSTTNSATAASKARDLQRFQEKAAHASEGEASVARKIANETEEQSKYQQQLNRENESAARKNQEDTKRAQAELRRRQEEVDRRQNGMLQGVRGQLKGSVAAQLPRPSGVRHDAFISHATEDKAGFVRPLAEALSERGLSVWYDEFKLKVGDSLRRSIDRGLAESRFGIVILSEAFFRKNWPQYELEARSIRPDFLS